SVPTPDPLDDYLVTGTRYNSRGLVEDVIDPRENTVRTLYDDLGRPVATIEAYDNATVTWDDSAQRWEAANLDDDQDRVTTTVYDNAGRLWRQVAHLPDGLGGEQVQITTHNYS